MSTLENSLLTSRWLRQLGLWMRNKQVVKRLTQLLIVAAFVSTIATYSALTSAPPFGSDPEIIFMLMNINVVLMLCVGAIVARKIANIWAARRQNIAGSKLYSRIAIIFSLIAVTPAVIVAIFSALFFDFGVNTWFSQKVTTALNESRAVAQSYLQEHMKVIRADVLAMGNDLNRQAADLIDSRQLLETAVRTHAALRNFTEVLVFQSSGDILARAGLTYVLELEPLSDDALKKARAGEVVLLLSEEGDRVRALVRVDRFVDTFLYVGRYVEPRVLAHIQATEEAVKTFETLQFDRSGLQISFALVYIIVSLLLLVISLWAGLTIATQIVTPISELIRAADKVRAGDLSVKLEEEMAGSDEISTLKRAFNRMTAQLSSQRTDLMDANRELDERRRFIEAVLSGVSAGIIGLDADGKIQYPNAKATELLNIPLHDYIDQTLMEIAPEFGELFAKAATNPAHSHTAKLRRRVKGGSQTLLARLTAEILDNQAIGYVLTFDDITDLINAQRTATWADMARRLAHEIRNPLTPIQLAADRLKRNYAGQITKDREQFESFLDVIIRQVDDLGLLLSEFSSFARMPAPQLQPVNLREIISDSVLLMREKHADVTYTVEKTEPVILRADPTQLRQVFNNILKNAAEAIEEQEPPYPKGKVQVSFEHMPDLVKVIIKDNGKGLPTEESEQLIEPYYTTREQGSGLGLSVVAKIMEDHGGKIRFRNNKGRGATVELIFDLKAGQKTEPKDDEKGGDKDFFQLAKSIATQPNTITKDESSL